MKTTPSLIATLVTLALLAGARPAAAEQAPDRGPELALRLGYTVPFGDAERDTAVDSSVSGAIPLLLEAGFRFNPNVFVGGYFQYALAQVKGGAVDCDANGNSCSGSQLRLGVEGIYRFTPDAVFAPWLGLGLGYEWLKAELSTTALGGISGDHTYSGIELVNLQAGGDYRAGRALVIGPFVSLSVARFSSESGSFRIGGGTGSSDGDITDTAVHTWLSLGVRGAFTL